VSLGNIVDKFSDQHGLADACTTDFSSSGVRGKEVDKLDACL
jgi:hypothetical protein